MTSVFATFDKNGDGLITKQELRESLKNIQISATEKEELKEAFEVFDGDKDGLITVEELGSVLSSLGMKEGKKMEDCKEMIRRVDVDGDGMVNFDEFKTMMMRNGGRLLSSV
ncbi:Calmodulin-like protein 3 [Linum perenne]